MKQKPYKSLDQVYLSESFAKFVPPLPRQTVLGEKNKSGVYPDPGKHVQYYFKEPGFAPSDAPKMPKSRSVTDPQTQKSKRQELPKQLQELPYEVPSEVKKGESQLISLALKILNGKGQGIEGAAREMISKLREIFSSDDKNEEFNEVRKTLISLQDPNNKIKDLPPENKKFNLVNEIFIKTKKLYSEELIKALLNTASKGSTNLGKVELGLTIFYADAKKATKGGDVTMQRSDYHSVPVQIGTITYEVKGPDGRMGDGDDTSAKDRIVNYMDGFYSKHNINKKYELIDIGGKSTILISNIYNSINEILKVKNSTIQELFELILKSSPKPNTPQEVVKQFFEAAAVFNKEDFKNEDFIKKLSTALQMQTYRMTDGHMFQKLFAYNNNFETLVIDVSNFTFLEYVAMLEKQFEITKPESDSKYSAFGITIL